MKLPPLAWFLILIRAGPGAATGTSSLVSTSGPPVLCTRTAATIAAFPARLARAANRPGGGNVSQQSLWIKPSDPRRTPPVALCHDVERLDCAGKRHGEIDISAWNMELEAVGDQCDADQHKEGERQHFRGGVLRDECTDRRGRRIHHDHGDDHGGDHNL